VLGGELLEAGVGLEAETAFLITWVTVGITHLSAESLLLGRRFAIVRNVVAFVGALVIAWLAPPYPPYLVMKEARSHLNG
jgi:uncharacterized membrane protein YraQ (UPF0718 family)